MNTFDKCAKLFAADRLGELAASAEGLLWLKIKSISRKEILADFSRFANIPLSGKTVAARFCGLHTELASRGRKAHNTLNKFIKERAVVMSGHEQEHIASELHKMQSFVWGGDYTNALDKFLVDRYIKRLRCYDDISHALESDIPRAVQGYVLCSWYNHWSTFLIENIFARHEKVLPAIGKVKKIDFFICDLPFDLKTTYLPANFVRQKRKDAGLPDELSALKAAAKASNIAYDSGGSPREIAYEITERMKISGDEECRACLDNMRQFRRDLLCECAKNPQELITNLYAQQGEMRFDSSNRLFVVLANTNDFDESWKLKRNPRLLEKSIHAYLDSFSRKKARRITFTHKAKHGKFTALSDAIFIIAGEGEPSLTTRKKTT